MPDIINEMKKTKAKKRSESQKQSATAMAAEIGVSRSTLYDWRSKGAPIDKGAEAVLSWAMDNDKKGNESDDIRQARLAVLRETERRLKLANDEKSKELIAFSEVNRHAAAVVGWFFSEFDRMAAQYPALLKGLSEVETQTLIQSDCADAKANLRARLEAFETKHAPTLIRTQADGTMVKAVELAQKHSEAMQRYRAAVDSGDRGLSAKIWHEEVTPLEEARFPWNLRAA